MHCTVDRLVLSGVESVRKYYKDSSGGNNYVHLLTSTVHEYNCEVFVLYLSIWIQCYFILSIEILYFPLSPHLCHSYVYYKQGIVKD